MHLNPDIIKVPAERILPLREKILRAGMPGLSARFDGDDNPTTVHLAVLIDSAVVGCVTFLDSMYEGLPAWQVRGMAVDESCRGMGLGKMLLEEGMDPRDHQPQPDLVVQRPRKGRRFLRKTWLEKSLRQVRYPHRGAALPNGIESHIP